jgi:hypothetical protein
MSLVRRWLKALWWLGLCPGCGGHPDPAATSPSDAGEPDPPPFTLETLGGTLYAPGSADVAWAYAFPGDLLVPPEVALGPDNELIALVIVERRPKPPAKLVEDTLLLRFDAATGDLVWMQALTAYPDYPGMPALALDSRGDIILAATTRLWKLDPDGKLLWSKTRTPENGYELMNMAIGPNDDLLFARVELNAGYSAVGEESQGFVELEKLDADANPVWIKRFGEAATYLDGAYAALDADDNAILLAAGLNGPVDFGGGSLAGEDVLAKYDVSGNYVFGKPFDAYTPPYQASKAILTDAAGDITLWTESIGPIDIGLGELDCVRYVMKFDATGAPLWNRCIDTDDLTAAPDGGYIASSSPLVTQKYGSVECSPDDGMLSRFDADGNWLATRCPRDPGLQNLGNVAPDPSGMFFMTAAFSTQLTLPDYHEVPALDDGTTALVAKVNVRP